MYSSTAGPMGYAFHASNLTGLFPAANLLRSQDIVSLAPFISATTEPFRTAVPDQFLLNIYPGLRDSFPAPQFLTSAVSSLLTPLADYGRALSDSMWASVNSGAAAAIGRGLDSHLTDALWEDAFAYLASARESAELFAEWFHRWFHRHAVIHGPYSYRVVWVALQRLTAAAVALALARAQARQRQACPPPSRQATSRPQIVRGPTLRGMTTSSAEPLVDLAAT